MQLPFASAAFDLVVCQFGVMFFPDKAAAFAEARRVLRPGGALLFNVWDRIEANEFADVVTAALAALYPGDPPRFMARTPHGYFDSRTDRTGSGRCGIQLATGDRDRDDAQPRPVGPGGRRWPTARERRCATKSKHATSRDSGRRRTLRRRRSAERFGSGAVDGKIQAHVVTVER